MFIMNFAAKKRFIGPLKLAMIYTVSHKDGINLVLNLINYLLIKFLHSSSVRSRLSPCPSRVRSLPLAPLLSLAGEPSTVETLACPTSSRLLRSQLLLMPVMKFNYFINYLRFRKLYKPAIKPSNLVPKAPKYDRI